MLTGQVVLVVVNTDGGARAVVHSDCLVFEAVVSAVLEEDADLRDLLASLCAKAEKTVNGERRSFVMAPPIST